MLARLTNSIRIRAGRLLALVYLVCVLAPAGALAFGNPAPCQQLETDTATIMQADAASRAARHMHDVGSHDHGGMHTDASHVHHHHGGKAAPGPCCALMCLSAMPAALLSLATPDLPALACAGETDRSLHGEAPTLLYRPPIA